MRLASRLTLLLLLAALAPLLSGCLGPDPIIGKWTVSSQYGELKLEMKKDGTGAYDPASVDALVQQLTSRLGALANVPQVAQVRNQAAGQLKGARITWKKSKDIYELGNLFPIAPGAGTLHARIKEGVLTFCSADGGPAAGAPPITMRKDK